MVNVHFHVFPGEAKKGKATFRHDRTPSLDDDVDARGRVQKPKLFSLELFRSSYLGLRTDEHYYLHYFVDCGQKGSSYSILMESLMK